MGRGNAERVAGFVLVVVLAAAAAAVVPAASASPAEGFQPLSKIAIHRATVELQRSAYVRATPSLLGEQAKRPATSWSAELVRHPQILSSTPAGSEFSG
ncbi:hypothetical protein ACP70R_001238 [Stipagrostis hirtigluma subsp. patula]